jgi:hypothetical protein
MSGWHSGLRRCIQLAVLFGGRIPQAQKKQKKPETQSKRKTRQIIMQLKSTFDSVGPSKDRNNKSCLNFERSKTKIIVTLCFPFFPLPGKTQTRTRGVQRSLAANDADCVFANRARSYDWRKRRMGQNKTAQ